MVRRLDLEEAVLAEGVPVGLEDNTSDDNVAAYDAIEGEVDRAVVEAVTSVGTPSVAYPIHRPLNAESRLTAWKDSSCLAYCAVLFKHNVS